MPDGMEVQIGGRSSSDPHYWNHQSTNACAAGGWRQINSITLWTNKAADKENLACTDDDSGIDEASEGEKTNCSAAKSWCEDPKKGTLAKTHCPKTCGVCTAAPTACADNNAGIDEASEGEKTDCAVARDWCEDAKKGTMAKKHCPKTCGACTGVQQVNVELDDVVSGTLMIFRM